VFATFLGLVLFASWVFHETRLRRVAGSEPARIATLFRFLQKASTPDRRYSAMGFAAASLITFGAWEGMIRGMLQFPTHFLSWLLGLGAFAIAFALRRRSPARLRREEIWLGVGAFLILCQAWWCFVVFPWLVWRASFLPSLRPASRTSVSN